MDNYVTRIKSNNYLHKSVDKNLNEKKSNDFYIQYFVNCLFICFHFISWKNTKLERRFPCFQNTTTELLLFNQSFYRTHTHSIYSRALPQRSRSRQFNHRHSYKFTSNTNKSAIISKTLAYFDFQTASIFSFAHKHITTTQTHKRRRESHQSPINASHCM